MQRFSTVIVFIFLGACTAGQLISESDNVQGKSTLELWTEQQFTPSALRLAYVEAELASRGETKSGRAFIGQRSAGALGRSIYGRSNRLLENSSGGADLLNCSDFTTSFAAQRHFLNAGGPVNDPNRLDADGDGLACEWGTRISNIARAARTPAPRPVRAQRSYTPRCFTGPRGGRYTITASGGRDYNGC